MHLQHVGEARSRSLESQTTTASCTSPKRHCARPTPAISDLSCSLGAAHGGRLDAQQEGGEQPPPASLPAPLDRASSVPGHLPTMGGTSSAVSLPQVTTPDVAAAATLQQLMHSAGTGVAAASAAPEGSGHVVSKGRNIAKRRRCCLKLSARGVSEYRPTGARVLALHQHTRVVTWRSLTAGPLEIITPHHTAAGCKGLLVTAVTYGRAVLTCPFRVPALRHVLLW